MRRRRITKHQVLCYINWTLGMTQERIAAAMGVTQQVVNRSLSALRDRQPDLFAFGGSATTSRSGHPLCLWQLKSSHDEYVTHKF